MKKEVKPKKYRKAVFIVTYALTEKGIEYAILNRKLHWKGHEFPKGKIERFEPKRLTARRELKEELGLKTTRLKKFREKGKYEYTKILKDRPEYRGQTYHLFAARVNKGKIVVDKKEHINGKWMNYKQAYKTLTWPNQRKCLKIVNNYLQKKN